MCNDPANGPITTPNPSGVMRPCYTGISLPGNGYSFGDYVLCEGQCANITATIGNGTKVNLYTCDPASICYTLGLNDRW